MSQAWPQNLDCRDDGQALLGVKVSIPVRTFAFALAALGNTHIGVSQVLAAAALPLGFACSTRMAETSADHALSGALVAS